MQKLILALAFCLTQSFTIAQADTGVISAYVPNSKLVGKGRLSYMVWNIFDAKLYAPNGRWNPKTPFALSLNYLRSFSGADITERSIDEIRKNSSTSSKKLARWQRQMGAIFPDVTSRTTITGIRNKQGHTVFLRNGKKIGTIRDREFSDRFFGIWLGRNSSNQSLRRKLIGSSI